MTNIGRTIKFKRDSNTATSKAVKIEEIKTPGNNQLTNKIDKVLIIILILFIF